MPRSLQVLGFASVIFLESCGGAGVSPSQSGSQTVAGQDVAVVADSPDGLSQQIAQARQAGLNPQFLTVTANGRTYNFTAYARAAVDGSDLILLGYAKVYAFPLASVQLTFGAQTKPIAVAALPSINVAADQLTPDAECPDCSGTTTQRATIRAFAGALAPVPDPWQIAASYSPWKKTPVGAVKPPKADITTIITVSTGGGGGPSISGGAGGGGGGCPPNRYIARGSSGKVVPVHVDCGVGGGGGGGGGGAQTNAAKILSAANSDKGMNTRGMYGAPKRKECVAALEQVLKDAAFSQIANSNAPQGISIDVGTFTQGLQNEGYTSPSQADAVPGDIVDLSGEHVGVCTNYGCTSMISNSSTSGTFSWTQSTATQNAAEGNGPITIFHHP
jgi:hypothetical protein